MARLAEVCVLPDAGIFTDSGAHVLVLNAFFLAMPVCTHVVMRIGWYNIRNGHRVLPLNVMAHNVLLVVKLVPPYSTLRRLPTRPILISTTSGMASPHCLRWRAARCLFSLASAMRLCSSSSMGSCGTSSAGTWDGPGVLFIHVTA